MFRWILATCILCISLSCHHRNAQEELSARFHDDGRVKPSVVLSPVINSTSSDLSWNLSEELTSQIRVQLVNRDQLYLAPRDAENFSGTENPFSADISWVKESFPKNEFVVFLDLVEHDNVPVQKNAQLPPLDVSTNLNMTMRVRILDVRGNTPKIILQELVKSSYYIPKTILKTDYTRVLWGTEEYNSTPLAKAHMQLVKEISERIHDYILLVKSE